ncbi:MAG: helix-turn-helix transcriptional regulator [Gammaproteobacteria bacterium]|nr:helix-turn-helix transcriptional regulator [Gammaproteobacteria bacterium]
MNINGSYIKQLRVEKGWTQQHLADIAGVSMRTIQRAENSGMASMDTISALAASFEIERGDFLVQSQDKAHQKLIITPIMTMILVLISFAAGVAGTYFMMLK